MIPERTLQAVVDSLGERGEKTALVFFGKKDRHGWSFKKLADCARSFANGLAKDGFKRGDTVALFAENRPEWIAAALGIIRAGAVAVPLDVQLGDKTLVHTLQDSDARAIITTQKRAGRIGKLDLKEKPKLILLDAGEDDEQSWKRFLESEEAELPTMSRDDEAVLFYTSGTTGPPKGVPLRHGNIVSQLDIAAEVQAHDGRRSRAAPAAPASRLPVCDRHAGPARSRSAIDSAIFAERPAVVARPARRRSDGDRWCAAALQRALFRH